MAELEKKKLVYLKPEVVRADFTAQSEGGCEPGSAPSICISGSTAASGCATGYSATSDCADGDGGDNCDDGSGATVSWACRSGGAAPGGPAGWCESGDSAGLTCLPGTIATSWCTSGDTVG